MLTGRVTALRFVLGFVPFRWCYVDDVALVMLRAGVGCDVNVHVHVCFDSLWVAIVVCSSATVQQDCI